MTSPRDPREYLVDYDWLWTRPPHNDGTPATLRLRVTDGKCTSARERVDAWLAEIADPDGFHGSGGWAVSEVAAEDTGSVILLITSGGEDVADGIQDGSEEAFEHLGRGTDLGLAWTQLPRR